MSPSTTVIVKTKVAKLGIELRKSKDGNLFVPHKTRCLSLVRDAKEEKSVIWEHVSSVSSSREEDNCSN